MRSNRRGRGLRGQQSTHDHQQCAVSPLPNEPLIGPGSLWHWPGHWSRDRALPRASPSSLPSPRHCSAPCSSDAQKGVSLLLVRKPSPLPPGCPDHGCHLGKRRLPPTNPKKSRLLEGLSVKQQSHRKDLKKIWVSASVNSGREGPSEYASTVEVREEHANGIPYTEMQHFRGTWAA